MVDKHVIFIRTGKVAGTSIEIAFAGEPGDMGWKGNKYISILPQKGRITEIQSNRISYMFGVRQFKLMYRDIWDDSFKFMAVRNPYDRFISAWAFFEFKDDPMKVLLQKHSIGVQYHLTRPQLEGIDHQIIDYFIYFENIKHDFAQLCYMLEINDVELGVHRTSKHEHFTHYYDQKLADKVHNMFERDFRLLGYDRDSWKG